MQSFIYFIYFEGDIKTLSLRVKLDNLKKSFKYLTVNMSTVLWSEKVTNPTKIKKQPNPTLVGFDIIVNKPRCLIC